MFYLKAAVLAAASVLWIIGFTAAEAPQAPAVTCNAGATAMSRLELLFGMAKRDGGAVSETEWRAFLDEEITPRFPDGLTVLIGEGQWRKPDGGVGREAARILIIWHVANDTSESRIEAVRDAYKRRFQQDSVMRVDGVSCVSF
ncbi:MAG: DUF3574 domain-containing protein [Hyphomicrobiales bacterium]|nr:DUF3574 domain-containing protein [Hyphomicrobiales bacterium]